MARTSKSTSNRSVRNNSAKPSAKAASSGASQAQSKQASKPKPKAAKVDPDYQLSSEVLSEEHNEVHPPDMAYGIVVNDEPAGILIPLDQLEEAGWTDLPDEDDLTTCKFGKNRVTGLFLTQARVLILGKLRSCTILNKELPKGQKSERKGVRKVELDGYGNHRRVRPRASL